MSVPPPFGGPVAGNAWDALDGTWPDVPPAVSVVVVHFRQQAQLDRTLDALARQTHPADRLEVVVVDDGSPAAPRVPAGVRLLVQEDRGFRAAAARNLGAAHATGDVLCFLDADTVPEPEYVARLTRLPALAPEAVTVARRRHADLASGTELEAPAWLEDAYARTGDLRRADARSYRFVISAVLACTRWFYAQVGPFDESVSEYGGEDWEWAHRAWSAGAVLAHVPDAVAWHDGPDWAGRTDGEEGGARRAAKNRETLRLAAAIPVPGSAPRALLGPRADVVVRLGKGTAGAALICLDSVLADLPAARVLVPRELAAVFADDPRVRSGAAPPEARVVIDLGGGPVRVRDGALRRAVARMDAEDLGRLELDDGHGDLLATLTSSRGAARAARWGRDDLLPARRVREDGLEALGAEPDLEAYLGGWG